VPDNIMAAGRVRTYASAMLRSVGICNLGGQGRPPPLHLLEDHGVAGARSHRRDAERFKLPPPLQRWPTTSTRPFASKDIFGELVLSTVEMGFHDNRLPRHLADAVMEGHQWPQLGHLRNVCVRQCSL
jgi:hypothetical protein